MSGLEYRESMNSLAYRAHLTCYPTGAPHTTNNNAALAAVATDCFKGILRYDLHRQQWLYNNEPMQDYHLTLINMELARRFLPTIGASAAIAVLEKLQTRDGYCFHPIRDYLNKLKWDGEKRLELMFIKIFGAEDNVYIRAAGRNFLTSAVARAMRPGCKVDTMLILEGAQGIGKTKALALMGLGSHIETTASMDSKDFIGQLQSAWFVDIAELDALRKAEIARVKGLLSMTEDIYRPPYGRLPVRRLRECVFVGSTNSDKYLVDDSGGRRFWPIACGDKIDIDLLTACLDQLYAEAVHRFKSGENWYEMPEQETEEAQNDRSTTEALPWFDFVQGYVSIPANMRKITWCGQPGVGVKIGEILHALEIPLERQTPGHLRDVARILRHLGYKGVQLRAVNMADGGADMKNFKTRYYIRMNWEHT
jgi:predicted P-loop ATPase